MANLTPSQALQFQNPGSNTKAPVEDVVTIASATTIAPTALISTVSGTAAIDTITLPANDFVGFIILIPTGAFTGTLSGNIGKTFTAVAAKALIMTYSAVTGKWYPSY